eukprot:CAMPEP_0195537510 /NCGR_PEP_ID=MMETSP0794_2-20130614/48030_1 /TAXON_ID=515487 /ORGANISM="Stephanopyxis turris, Strain CCMP 815" /LENGTH=139 /DNA_ID=CAMNT_0040671237 /DNA_START=9 /DNA_END=424 /DNA_ORIENTATION=-
MVSPSLVCFAPLLQHLVRNGEQEHVSKRTTLTIKQPIVPTISNIRSSTRRNAASTNLLDDDLRAKVTEGITEAGYEQEWNESIATLSAIAEIDTEQAEFLLADAWNWKGWARVTGMARKYMKTTPPNVDHLKAALTWLT